MERYTLDETRGDISYEVDGDLLILHVRPSVFAGLGGDGRYVIGVDDDTVPTDYNLFSAKRVLKEIGEGGGSVEIIKTTDSTTPTDLNVFSALRTLQEIRENNAYLDDLFLRKDIDDTAQGNITFCASIHSKDYIAGFDTGRGWMIEQTGDTDFNSVDVRSNLVVGNRSGSPKFISGFPNGIGWDLSPYKRINAADVEETKWRLEIDDINVRGKMRVYEFVISQLRGENDNVIFAGMMRVDHADPENDIIYLDTEKGVLYNPFRAGDILMVQRFGGMPSAANNYNVIKQYELRVKEAFVGNLADGEERVDWIEVEKFVGDWADVAERDVLTRVDSLTDSTRKGIVKVTTVDEIGAPYIDVVYGMKTNPDTATKVRMGNLSGVRTRNNRDLTGVWGLYAEGAVLENSTYYMENGQTVEQNFSVLNGKLESEISTIKSDMSLEAGNILKNSSFGSNMRYWDSTDEVHFIWTADGYVYGSDAFYVEKNKVADIVADNGRYVLRLRNNGIKQLNAEMSLDGVDFGSEEDEQKPNFSFSFFYKPLTSGTLKAGFTGKELYAEESLQPTSGFGQYSKYATWDGTGDFEISYTGEMLIYGVSLYNDKLADAKIYLEGKITQTAEALTVDYKKLIADSEGTIRQEISTQFQQTAESISAQAKRIDNINNTIANAGWITTADGNKLWADKYMSDGTLLTSAITQNAQEISLKVSSSDFTGNTIVSKINLLNGSAKIEAKNIDLIGKVTFDMLSQGAIDGVQPDLSGYEKAGTASAFDEAFKKALFGTTTIEGAYIKTDFINTKAIIADIANIGGFTISGNNLVNTDNTAGIKIGTGSNWVYIGKSITGNDNDIETGTLKASSISTTSLTSSGSISAALNCYVKGDYYALSSNQSTYRKGLTGAYRIDNSNTWYVFDHGVCVACKNYREMALDTINYTTSKN